jgi:hypothetical protein
MDGPVGYSLEVTVLHEDLVPVTRLVEAWIQQLKISKKITIGLSDTQQ